MCSELLPEPDRAKRSKQRDHLRRRLHADAETAIKMSNNWHYRTKKPGELGSEKEIIYDTQWDPECQIDTILWTPENSARFIHDENLKYWDSRTEFGCWGHTGYPTVIQNSLVSDGDQYSFASCFLFLFGPLLSPMANTIILFRDGTAATGR